MLPVILSCPDKAQAEKIIEEYIEKNALPQSAIHRIQRETAATTKGRSTGKKKEISVSQMRSLQQLFFHHHSNQRVIIIEDFDTASEEAQNALLKILEEKTVNTQFFLLASNYFQILPTIRSRSSIRIIKSKNNAELSSTYTAIAEKILKGDISALSEPLVQGITTEGAIELCDSMVIELRSRITKFPTTVPHLMKELLRIKNLIRQNNLNPQLAIDSLVLSQYR